MQRFQAMFSKAAPYFTAMPESSCVDWNKDGGCWPREGNRQPRLLRLAGSVVVIEYLWDEMTLTFFLTAMFPFLDIAHHLVSVMALKQRHQQ
ncbi:trimeric intracellular cation channel type B-like protein [Cricetulus griseus]|nr:trimeric intracellular cation channel type B-like protein [Cricetulus griseus]